MVSSDSLSNYQLSLRSFRVSTSAAVAATMSALNDSIAVEILLGYATNAGASLIMVRCEHTVTTAQGLVAGFLPFSYQGLIGPSFLNEPVVQLSRDILRFKKFIEYESGALVI